MIRQIKFELFKMSRRPRSYTGFAAFLFINFMILLGVKYGGIGGFAENHASSQGMVVGSPVNGEFLAYLLIGSPIAGTVLTMFLPFFICLVFGEIYAGESAEGTLRMVLSRPIKRSSFLTAKFFASFIYATALVLFMGITAYIIGLAFFGRGGLLAMGTFREPMLVWFGEAQGLARLGLSYGLTCVAMLTVGMIAFFISSWLNNALGAIGGAMMLLFTMLVVGEIPYFKSIHDYLFSTHLFLGQQAFLDPIPWGDIGFGLLCLGAYIAVFFSLSMLIFRRKDILT